MLKKLLVSFFFDLVITIDAKREKNEHFLRASVIVKEVSYD